MRPAACVSSAITQTLAEPDAFAAYLAPLRKAEWVVYAKPPFGGPEAVLAYLSRYTHRVAISNSRLIALDDAGVTFKWKDYRAKGRDKAKVMTLPTSEFIRRFLIHVLPGGFHRIRHYGLFANASRVRNIARARELLAAPKPISDTIDADNANTGEPPTLNYPCPCCGGSMIIIETFERGAAPRYPPPRQRAQSGSIPHDRVHRFIAVHCSPSSSLVLLRPRRNSDNEHSPRPAHALDGTRCYPTIGAQHSASSVRLPVHDASGPEPSPHPKS